MEIERIDALIRYHQDGLQIYRMQMSPSAQVLEQQTIEDLEELKDLKKPHPLKMPPKPEPEKEW